MKILFADAFPNKYIEALKTKGHHCEYEPDLSAETAAGVHPWFLHFRQALASCGQSAGALCVGGAASHFSKPRLDPR